MPSDAAAVHDRMQREAETAQVKSELAAYERAREFARRFRGADEWDDDDDANECMEFAAEAVAEAKPGIEREGANQRTRDIAFKVRNCLDATGAGKWRRADAILRLAYPDAFAAEIARLQEGGSDAEDHD